MKYVTLKTQMTEIFAEAVLNLKEEGSYRALDFIRLKAGANFEVVECGKFEVFAKEVLNVTFSTAETDGEGEILETYGLNVATLEGTNDLTVTMSSGDVYLIISFK